MFGSKKDPVIFGIILVIMIVNAPLEATNWTFQEIIIDDHPPQLSRITDCTIVDINGDQKPDLWFSARKGSHKDEDHFMPWYENTGDMKNWKRHLSFQGPACCGTWGDMDGDGDLDVFTAEMHGREQERVAICENVDGKGKSWSVHVLSKCGCHNAKVADLNADGAPDIAGKNHDEDKRPRIWINPNGPFNQATKNMSLDNGQHHVTTEDGGPRNGYHIFAADLNGDGKKDITTGDAWYENPGKPGDDSVRHGLDAGLGRIIAVFDFDRDGHDDILGGGFALARNDGAGNFKSFRNIAAKGGFIQGAAVGCFSRGRWDISVIYTHKKGDHIRRLAVPPNPASAEWTDHLVYDWAGKSKDIDVGDIDRVGDLDVMFVGRNSDTLQWLSNNGNGSFMVHTFTQDPSSIVHRCRLADIDGDGRLDVLTGSKGKKLHWHKRGHSAIGPWKENKIAGPGQLKYDPLSIDVADMDGDLDIISIGWTHNKVLLYENKCLGD